MFPLTHLLIMLWRTDPLRSFGVLIPFVSCALVARSWSDLRWERQGTWWGLLPLAASIVFSRFASQFHVTLQIHGVQIDPVQPGLILFVFVSGVLLLLGGGRLWKKSIFPLCLLLAVDPIPHVFTRFIDLPLQTASANVARRFAYLIGLHPTGKQLDLLFTPVLGMTIVPGCDGMRGSATMAYAALLIGYVRRYRPFRLAGLVIAAALLGYLLNFARLCILVGYYWVAFHFPALSADGVTVDYIIGGTIFLLVGLLAGALWLGGSGRVASTNPQSRVAWPTILRQPRMVMAASVLFVAVLTAVPSAYALLRRPDGFVDPSNAAKAFPTTAGPWRAVRQFTQDLYGHTVWQWTEYRRADGSTVQVALWLQPTIHRAIDSLNVHGEVALWQGGFDEHAANGVPVHFTVFTMLDHFAHSGPLPTYLAETDCLLERCGEPPTRGDAFLSIRSGSQQTLPILMQVQHPAGAVDIQPGQRAADQAAVADLMHYLDTRTLTERVGHQEPK